MDKPSIQWARKGLEPPNADNRLIKASVWINCAERMPEAMVDVLVWSPAFGIDGGEYDVAYRSRFVEAWVGSHVEHGCEWNLGDITHWMPLPEPPAV